MELISTRTIAAPPQTVWEALNDPAVLKDCIPGCESLDRVSDQEWRAVVAVRIGPVQARFNGRVQLADLAPPTAYTLRFDGQGGAAGFATGEARVTLTPQGSDTALAYEARAKVGGKLAQLGARLVDGVAAKLADDFFARFAARVGTPAEADGETEARAAAGGATPGPPPTEPQPMPGGVGTPVAAEIATHARAPATRVAPPGGSRTIRYVALAAIIVVLWLLYWYRGH
jgi:carbon monoxide dehydrogenase subunit G